MLKIVEEAIGRGYTLSDIQVLSPMYSGNAGIDVLNNALQQEFNPPSLFRKEIKAGYTVFREGDKVLQLKNQPDDDVYNGDIGVVPRSLTVARQRIICPGSLFSSMMVRSWSMIRKHSPTFRLPTAFRFTRVRAMNIRSSSCRYRGSFG